MSEQANLSTFVARVTDSMILVATMDSGLSGDEYKTSAKRILKTLKPTSPAKCTIEAGSQLYHYIIEDYCVYLTQADRTYPKRLAFQFLEAVHRDFTNTFPPEAISRFSRPYEAIQFEPKLSRLRREYRDSNSPQNLSKLNSDLSDIHSIMSQNINEVLQRGEKLDVIESRSSVLLAESKKFAKMSRYINLQALYKTYGPVAAIVLVILFILYWKLF